LNKDIYKRFAAAFLAIAPNFPLDAAEIETLVKTRGLDGFALIADGYGVEILEIADLLTSCGEGAQNG